MKPKPRVIFLHIPKTAGSTLYRIIEAHYRAQEIYTVWVDGSLDDFKRLDAGSKSELKVLRGHFGFGLHDFLPGPSRCFTLLREPVARVISYDAFVRRTPRHYSYDLVTSNKMSLADFIASKKDCMLDNAQTRLLSGLESGHEVPFGECGPDMLEAAKRNLRDAFAVVGLTERFDETLLLLREAFGWRRLFYARQNVSAKRPEKEELPSSTLDAILQINALDVQLYQYAQRLFEEQVGQYGASFAEDVDAFQATNRRLRPLIHWSWKARQFSARAAIREWVGHVLGRAKM